MPSIIRIDDPDDPALAGYVGIRERDLVRSHGQFIAEGTVVLTMLASPMARANGFVARSLLILENRLAGLGDLIEKFEPDCPVHVVSQSVMDKVAGFHLHRGVLALGERVAAPQAASLLAALPGQSLVVLAAGLSNHDNVGALFRNAAAFGADAVFLDTESCDPLYRKALRVSVGTVLSLPWSRGGNVEEMVSSLTDAGFALWGLSPRGKTDLGAIPQSPRLALLLGTEGEGLPESLMETIQTARIRQRPEIDSLNVSTAAGIALHAISLAMGRI